MPHKEESEMTATDKIVEHLRANQGRAFCDDCLSAILAITPRQQVQQKTFGLAENPRYQRIEMRCSRCGELNKLAIQMKLAA
jgi:hypothetical protein